MRSILITGCSTGIGLAAARTLKARGWRVLATARKPADLERLGRDDGLEALPLEMSDPASVSACALEALKRTGGRLDALYNNAAFGSVGAMEDVSGDLLRHHLEVNVVAAHALTRQIIPAMRAQGHGRIVMCSSVLGFVSGPYRGAYCASKFALEALSDALRQELAPAGIHVSILEPGPIESQFLSTALANFRQLNRRRRPRPTAPTTSGAWRRWKAAAVPASGSAQRRSSPSSYMRWKADARAYATGSDCPRRRQLY